MSPLSSAGDIRRLPPPHLVARPNQLDAVLQELTQRFSDETEGNDRDASAPFENFAELQRHGLVAAVDCPAPA